MEPLWGWQNSLNEEGWSKQKTNKKELSAQLPLNKNCDEIALHLTHFNRL
jgi:hypothetical protein